MNFKHCKYSKFDILVIHAEIDVICVMQGDWHMDTIRA
jgi:hypothetical protein